ncbi:hypothetical protein PVAND_007984 [Polypedilum vanderplanki]|uniref:Zinc finger PHD-type domain-containing protein n=1 Tax=Polypedilum vanderplanki TaxID=319348 RepID=A0A9J6C8A5_POLVA|nr:hypothetical protein PVAND_007984 [Polypedilum vanderplanki]
MSKTQNITISNQSSKIFIYNATSEKNVDHHHSKKSSESNKTSIEIQFSTPECHIRIENNSFKEKNPVDNTTTDEMLEKDMVSSEGERSLSFFNIDEDVLMEGTDGKFYLGTIINSESEDYLVRFDDNTEKWSNYCKLKKLRASPTKNGVDLSLCVICKVSKEFDVVEICDKCSRGYHRQCIKEYNSSSRWNCSRCSFDVISISDSEELESISTAEEFTQKPTKFPYDINTLKWDSAHRTNKENVYCYCGLTGSWKEKMLQCCRCRQWFHDKCVKIWSGGKYMLHGDTFFIFCCSVCNEGNEFIRRLQISWRDIIHLIFYDLTITRSQKYHSISKDVVPFILQNADKLFLPPEILKILTKELVEKKITQLVRKLDIFKSVNANKKKILYGLRKKSPPLHNYLQKVIIPKSSTTGPLTDDLMRKMKIKFVDSIDMNEISGTKMKCNENNNVTLIDNDKKLTLPSSADLEVCDSSDETSSKSTLDLIIPPPDNFKGFNNPFHVNYKSDVKFKISEKLNGLIKRNGNAVSSKFPEVRIVRTIKRRLSAKDLLLGPNSEVKKRRKNIKRRKSADVEVISEIIQPINFPLPPNFIRSSSMSTSSNIIAPTKNDIPKKSIQSKNNNNDKTKDEVKINLNETVLDSPVKNNSINLYFGAMHRIENGEKFTILAKRVTFDRKEQYLLDWDGKEKMKDHDVF